MDLSPKRAEHVMHNEHHTHFDLADHCDNEHISSIAEAVGHIYKGKVVQVYWSETGGSTSYADYSVHSHMFVEGTVLWGRGDVFALECEFERGGKKYKKQVLFNAWSATMIALKDDMDIDSFFKNRGVHHGREV